MRTTLQRPWSEGPRSDNLQCVKNRLAIKWARNPLLAALLLVTFFARALVPAGFMPGSGGLMLCPAYGPSTGALHAPMTNDMSTMDMSGMDMAGMDMSGMVDHGEHSSHGGGSRNHEGSLCPFAAAATTMASGHTAVLTSSVAIETGSVLLPDQPFVPRGTVVPTRLPRGPPDLPA